MNCAIKLFFDECLSHRIPKALEKVYAEEFPENNFKFVHLGEMFKLGSDDSAWLALLEKERDWIVVTADRGKDLKKEKLPTICNHLGITHIEMTSGFHQAGYLAHKHAFLMLFPQIRICGQLPRGTRISLGFAPYHQRNWPYLKIEGMAFDQWCIAQMASTKGGKAVPDSK